MARAKGIWLDIADWRRVTKGLSPEERGAYVELLITCVENDGRLENDDKALHMTTSLLVRIWNDFRRRLMPRLFYQAPDGCWRNEIVDHQLERAEKIREVRQAAGKAGAEKTWQKPASQDDGKEPDKPMANAIANDMANATLNSETVKPYVPNGTIGLSPPLVPPSKPRGGRRARRVYVPSPREVQIEGFAHALAERARNRNC